MDDPTFLSQAPNLPPEIVWEIVSYLEYDNPSLFQALQVNQTWADAATAVLWREPFCLALATIEPIERRQYYASRVQWLDFNDEEYQDKRDGNPEWRNEGRNQSIICQGLQSLSFPLLNKISLTLHAEACKDVDQRWVLDFLPPSLESFDLYGLDPSLEPDLRKALQCCPLLTELKVGDFNQASISELEAFLEGCPALRRLDLGSCQLAMEDYMSPNAFARLASRDNLEYLAIRRTCLQADHIEAALEQTKNIFNNLRSLTLVIESANLRRLVAALPSLTELDVELYSPVGTNNIMGPIAAALPRLQKLTIRFERFSEVAQSDFEELKHLNSLHYLKLELESEHWTRIPNASWMTDAVFGKTIADSLPHLEHLGIDFQSNLSVSAIEALGANCRKLFHLRLPDVFDLRSWVDRMYEQEDPSQQESRMQPMFPCLESWVLGDIKEPSPPCQDNTPLPRYDRSDIARAIMHHAPKLKGLYMEGGDCHGRKVQKTYEELIERRR